MKAESRSGSESRRVARLLWRDGATWDVTAPGCWVTLVGSEFGTTVEVQAHEDRFTEQQKMVAVVEITSCSGTVRKFRGQAKIKISVMAEKQESED